jgi:hypothetical protein
MWDRQRKAAEAMETLEKARADELPSLRVSMAG